ncbi:MAG: P1 family peptidase, partial [Alphaproteobacteria bacterium]
GAARVPIVPAAILFDLLNGGDKAWGATPPYRALGRAACEGAGTAFALGNHGAGVGAIAGDLKGGLGSVSVAADDGLVVGAVVAANPIGTAVMGTGPTLWAWTLERDAELGGQRPPDSGAGDDLGVRKRPRAGASTTIAVVATNARLTPAEARRVAIMAHDGIARAVRPAHTPYDGDTVFALGTGRFDADSGPDAVLRVGAMAADCVARALARGIYEAQDLGDAVSYRTRYRL